MNRIFFVSELRPRGAVLEHEVQKFLEIFIGFGRQFCLIGLLLFSQMFLNMTMKSLRRVLMRHVRLMCDAYTWMKTENKECDGL